MLRLVDSLTNLLPQQHFGVTPDMATFGKALVNGFPLAVVVGKAEIMEATADVWVAATHHGDAVSIVVSLATLGI